MEKRPYSLRLTWLAGGLLLLATLAMLWAAHRTISPLLVAEMQKNSAAVGRSVVKQFSSAVASGIPLGKLAGVDEMLEAVIGDNPSLNGIEVTDPAGKPLFASGDPLPADDRAGASPLTRPVVSSLPIVVNGATVGFLRVGSDLSFMADRVWLYLAATLGSILASLIVLHEAARLILARAIDMPSAQLTRALRPVLDGDFSTAVAANAPGTMGRAIRRLNSNLRAVADRFERFAASANAIRGLDLDAASADRLSHMLEDAKTRFPTLAEETGRQAPTVTARPDGRWLMLILTLLSEMVRPLVPVIGADRILGGLEPGLLAGVPLGLYLVGIGFGSVLAPLVWPVRRNGVFLIAVLLMAAALIATAATDSAMIFWASRLVGGIGLGLAWRVLINRYRADIQQDGNALLAAAIGFHAVGPMIGAVLGEGLGTQAALWLIAGLSLLCAFYGWASLRAMPQLNEAENDDSLDATRVWSAGIMAVIVGALMFQALPVLGLTAGTLMASIPHFAAFGAGLLLAAKVGADLRYRNGIGPLLAAAGLALFLLVPTVFACAAALFVLGFGWGVMRATRPSSGILLIDTAGGLIGVSLASLATSSQIPNVLLILGLPALGIGLLGLLRSGPTLRQEP